jgi:DNA-binding transcriptional ArsR family regulator
MDGFAVLAEPNRRRILDHLRERRVRDHAVATQGVEVGALVSALALPQPTVSKHLRVLRDAGAVTVRVRGPRRLYQIAPQPLADVAKWLEPYQQLWEGSLDALERHLDQTDDTGVENHD